MADKVKLTYLQRLVLEKASVEPDGAHLYAAKYSAARSLERRGLVKVLQGTGMGRACITPAGRALLSASGKTGE